MTDPTLAHRIAERLNARKSLLTGMSTGLTESSLNPPSASFSSISGAPNGPSDPSGLVIKPSARQHFDSAGGPALGIPLPAFHTMQSNLDSVTSESIARGKELNNARLKTLALERDNAHIASELKSKDMALRRTVAESAGERQALVEALQQAKAQVNSLREDYARREDLVHRLESRLTARTEELKQLTTKLSNTEIELQDERLISRKAAQDLEIHTARYESATHEISSLKELNKQLKTEVDELKLKLNMQKHAEDDLRMLREKYKEESEEWMRTKAELQQARGDLSVIDSKMKAMENDSNETKKRMEYFKNIDDEASQLRKKMRVLTEENEQLLHQKGFLDQHLTNEREAGIAISNYTRCIINNEDPSQAATDLDKYRETSLYSCFSSVLAKLRSECSKVKSLEDDCLKAEKNISAMRRENIELADAKEALQVELARMETAMARNNSGYDSLSKDMDELKIQRDKIATELEKLRVESNSAIQMLVASLASSKKYLSSGANALAMQGDLSGTVMGKSFGASTGINMSATGLQLQSMIPGDLSSTKGSGSISDVASNAATYITKLQQEIQLLNRENDELGTKYTQLELQNRELSNNSTDSLAELESGKRKLVEQTGRLMQLETENNTLTTNLIVSGQTILCLLREVNDDQDRLKRIHCSRELAATLLNRALLEISSTREVLLRYEESSDPKKSRLNRTASKVRVAVHVITFLSRLEQTMADHRGYTRSVEERLNSLLQVNSGPILPPANVAFSGTATAGPLGATTYASLASTRGLSGTTVGGTAATLTGIEVTPPPILELCTRFCQALQNHVRLLSDYRYGGFAMSARDDRARAIVKLLDVMALAPNPTTTVYSSLRYTSILSGRTMGGMGLGIYTQRPLTLAELAMDICKYMIKRNDNLYNGLTEKESFVAQVQGENEILRNKVNDLNCQLLDLGTRFSGMQTEMKTDFVAIDEYESVVKDRDQMKFKLNNAEYQNQELHKDNEQIRSDVEMYKRELERASESAKQYEMNINELNLQIREMTNTIAQYKVMSANFEGQLSINDNQRRDMDNMVNFLNKEIEQLQVKIRDLTSDLTVKHNGLVERDEMIGRLSLQLEEEIKARKAVEDRMLFDTEERRRKAENRINLLEQRTTIESGLARDIANITGAPSTALTTGSLNIGLSSPGYGTNPPSMTSFTRPSTSVPAYPLSTAGSQPSMPPTTMAKEDIRNLIAQLDKSLGMID